MILELFAMISLKRRSENNESGPPGWNTSGKKSDTQNFKCSQIENIRIMED